MRSLNRSICRRFRLGIHCVESGSVKLRRGGPRGDDLVVGLAGPGETLGYLVAIGRDKRLGGDDRNTLEWLVMRPIHFVVSSPKLEPVFGHVPHESPFGGYEPYRPEVPGRPSQSADD